MAVMLEAPVLFHASIEGRLPGMAERWMAQVVSQGDRFRQVFIEAQLASDGPADLGDLQRMRQARAVVIVRLSDEDLRLVHEPPKGGRMDDAIAIALIERTIRMRFLGVTPPPALTGPHRIGSEEFLLPPEPVGSIKAGGILFLAH